MNSRKKKTILGLAGLGFLSLSIFLTTIFLRSDESVDTSSEAAIEDPDRDPEIKYGVLIKNDAIDGTFNAERSSKYLDIVDANFDVIITQYGRMSSIHRDSRDNYNWDLVDPMVNWGLEHDKEILYHNLLHHNDKIDNPKYTALNWYDELPSDAERLVALEEFVRTVIDHYDGKIKYYHLINHFLYQDGNGNYMNTGKDIEEAMVLAFQWANEENESNVYIANAPSGGLFVERAKDLIIERVNRVNSQLPEGSKIDAIGIMGHLGRCSGEIPDTNVISSYLTEIHEETGLPIHISELDIAYDYIEGECDNPKVSDPYQPFTTRDGEQYDSWFLYQGHAYKELYDLFTEHEAVDHVFTWGFYDGAHWRKHAGFFFGPNQGDKANDFDPKPAYTAIKELTCISLCSDRQCGYDGCGGQCDPCSTGNSCSTSNQCFDMPDLIIEKNDGSSTVKKGNELKMVVSINGNQFETDHAIIDFNYDANKLQFKKVTYPDTGTIFKRKVSEETGTQGVVKIARNSNGEALKDNKIIIATIHFNTISAGDAKFTFRNNVEVLLRGESILDTAEGSTVSIVEGDEPPDDPPPDDPPPEETLGCKNFKISKPKVISNSEQITISVEGVLSQEIELFVSAGGQTNKNPSDLVCEAENKSDPEYSYYCAGTKTWFPLKKASGTTTAITTTFADLKNIIDDGVQDGNPYSGDLEDLGIVVAANVRTYNPTDICSSNIARNNGDGVSWEDGAWDKTCNGGCFGTIEFSEYVPPDEPPPDDPPPDDPPPDDPPPDDPPYVPPQNDPTPITPPPSSNNNYNRTSNLPSTADESGVYRMAIGIVVLFGASMIGGYELVFRKIKVSKRRFNRDH